MLVLVPRPQGGAPRAESAAPAPELAAGQRRAPGRGPGRRPEPPVGRLQWGAGGRECGCWTAETGVCLREQR